MIKILVAEDEEKSRAATVSRLRGIMGDEALIETAADGNDAVQMALKMRPALIFMDIEMPVMDGNEATKQIRKMYRVDAKVIPIVAMTAHLSRQDIRMAQEAGMDMHVPKPIDIQKLKEVLEKYLK